MLRSLCCSFVEGPTTYILNGTVMAHESSGPARLGDVVARLFAPEQRSGGKGVGGDAVHGRDSDGGIDALGKCPGTRIDDVVDDLFANAPGSGRDRRRG